MDSFSFLIVTGTPDNTEFGIDFLAINITEQFRGVKFIPQGPHFVYSSSKDHFGNPSTSRSGFLHYYKGGEILVKEWNAKNEELQDRTRGDVELEKQRIKENIKDLDRFLAMYEFENIGKWKSLTSLITEDAVQRLSPPCKIIRNSVEFKSCTDENRPRGKPEAPIRNVRIRSTDDEAMYLPKMEVIAETQPQYSKLPERYNQFSSPAEKTFNNIDTVNLIDKLFTEITTPSNLLEELQFCFIVYLCCLSIDSLAHWRQILSLLCNSEQAVEKYRTFYLQFINVIKHQLPEIPIEFIEQNSTNTIYLDIKNLLRNLIINGITEPSELLQKHLDDTISWTFEDLLEEDPEDLPQIVDLSS
ncbi:hypothetical protein PVAND_000560 [Polypedilum vanderplanki]|uniref:Protein AAR2 homolog n=1 Tax=Polypedilum vanderplanki TaxID=319348 RepID=A0A9J6BLB6_POLVA|nr:hypothetical protein PVAND_000560 [Polypedilum vanderplanki]